MRWCLQDAKQQMAFFERKTMRDCDIWYPDVESQTFVTDYQSHGYSNYYLIADWRDLSGIAVVLVPIVGKLVEIENEWREI